MSGPVLHHFSENPSITRFEPHVPETNPGQPASVWAIDTAHAPLYWFPRNCPRATAWLRPRDDQATFASVFETAAHRLHVMEIGWVDRMRQVRLFRYDFDPTKFRPWPDASGQFVSDQAVEPLAVTDVGDLFERHRLAGIELRFVDDLWPVVDLMVDERWDFSHVRLGNAAPRRGPGSP